MFCVFIAVLDLEAVGKLLSLSVFLLNPEFSAVSEWPDNKGTARRQVEDFCYFMSHVINLITA